MSCVCSWHAWTCRSGKQVPCVLNEEISTYCLSFSSYLPASKQALEWECLGSKRWPRWNCVVIDDQYAQTPTVLLRSLLCGLYMMLYKYIYIYIFTLMYIYIYLFIYTHVYTYRMRIIQRFLHIICKYIYIYIYIYTHVYTYMCTYIYYTHPFIHHHTHLLFKNIQHTFNILQPLGR